MVNFLKKRLQVFVSSTYIDLREERQAAVEAILSAGHIPAGMELFAAGDESQMEVIKQWIDESDVYLLILGGRYGSIEPTSGKSYIHLEYEYALNKGMALFSCVLQDPDERANRLGFDYIERENYSKFKEFSKIVKSNKVVSFWSDKKDIKLSIMQTLQDFARREDLIGWVRGNEQIKAGVTEELARLSEENFRLRQQIANLEEKKFIGLSYEEMKKSLSSIPVNFDDLKIKIELVKQNFIRLNTSDILDKIKIEIIIDFYNFLEPISNLLDLFENLVNLLEQGTLKLNYLILNDIDGYLYNVYRNEGALNSFSDFFSQYLKELQIRGLLEKYNSSREPLYGYQITSSGQEFLNRLALEKSTLKQN